MSSDLELIGYAFFIFCMLSSGKGNITIAAEFNFRSDPEAAYVVLQSIKCDVTMITWELCQEFALSWVRYVFLISSCILFCNCRRLFLCASCYCKL